MPAFFLADRDAALAILFRIGYHSIVNCPTTKRVKLHRLANVASAKIDSASLSKVVGLNEFICTSTKYRAGRQLFSYLYSLADVEKFAKRDHARVDSALKVVKELSLTSPPLVVVPKFFCAKAVHLYTDAAASAARNAMGAVIFIESGVYGFTVKVPDVWVTLGKSMQNPIALFEALAVLCVVHNFNVHIVEKRVVSHVDNSVVMGALVKGYSGVEILGDLVKKVHCAAFVACNTWRYFVYVASKFNLSDALTRTDETQVSRVGQLNVQLVDAEVPF